MFCSLQSALSTLYALNSMALFLIFFHFCLFLKVRFIAARAAVAFLVDQVLEQQQKQFVDIVPGVMQVHLIL